MANAGQENLREDRPTTAAEMVESIIGCKWSTRVLGEVRRGVHRPGELERACAPISTKVLNERLHKLTRFGILERLVYPESPPRVEYRFTDFGRRFLAVLDEVERLQRSLDTPGEGADAGAADP